MLISPASAQKHLHGRGEDKYNNIAKRVFSETPPRAWRRPALPFAKITQWGNTSTGVEKTILDGFCTVV